MAKKKNIENESFGEFIDRQYGKGVLISGNDIVERKREVLPTILSLDLALSGGMPFGITALISGKPKVGKTSICLQILKNAIDHNKPAYYFDIERRCSKSLLNTIQGLDPLKINIIKSTEEKNLNAEDYLNILERTIKDNKNAVIVVDSLAMLSTMAEQAEVIGSNKDMSGPPKLLSAFFRRTQQVIDNNNIILIFISQLITNRDPNGKKYIEKGGMGIQYATSVWLNCTWAKIWEKDPNTNAPLGQDVQIQVVCSALGPPFLPCSVPIRYGSGPDIVKDVVINAENVGLIQRAGAWYSLPMFKDEKDEPIKLQGIDKICEYLNLNKDKLEQLDKNIREMLIPKI
jgi:recombination protein RecA